MIFFTKERGYLMKVMNQASCPTSKVKKKHNLKLKSARVAAGYDSRQKFVEAANAYLQANNIDYEISVHTYTNLEMGISTNGYLKAAYYVAKFLNCPIDIFIEQKI